MRFSVVTPVLNGMPWLPAAVASVDAQRVDVDVEHVILDGGSNDGSRAWLEANAARAQLVFERDDGQSDAIARGFARATGDVLLWLNADDLLEPGALAKAAAALTAAPGACGVSGACLLVDEEGRVTGAIPTPPGGAFDVLIAHPHNLAQPATFFRRSAFDACGGLDRALVYAMDVDLWMKLARRGAFTLLPDEVLARFRIQRAAKTVKHAAAAAREDLAVRRRHGMSWSTPAARALVRFGFVQPALLSVARRVGLRRAR